MKRNKRLELPAPWRVMYDPPPQKHTEKMVTILVYGTDLVECGPPWEIWLCQTQRPYNPDQVYLLAERMKQGMKTIWPEWCPEQEPKVRITVWDKEIE